MGKMHLREGLIVKLTKCWRKFCSDTGAADYEVLFRYPLSGQMIPSAKRMLRWKGQQGEKNPKIYTDFSLIWFTRCLGSFTLAFYKKQKCEKRFAFNDRMTSSYGKGLQYGKQKRFAWWEDMPCRQKGFIVMLILAVIGGKVIYPTMI